MRDKSDSSPVDNDFVTDIGVPVSGKVLVLYQPSCVLQKERVFYKVPDYALETNA